MVRPVSPWLVSALLLPLFSSAAAEEVAVIETAQGEIVWRFFPAAAPRHVAYVKELISSGFYDGTYFHRIIPHFVVQGGDPNTKDADRSNDGEGEAKLLDAEFSKTLHYRAGTVGMARGEDPNSGSCQFFIAVHDLPRLDGKYTIFGEVISGLDVAKQISTRPRDTHDNPLESITIKARLERRAVPGTVLSATVGNQPEVLSGPDKPRLLVAGDKDWTAPLLVSELAPIVDAPRLELAIDSTGVVIDVRFPDRMTAAAAAWSERARAWKFSPAMYQGKPTAVRFEIDGDGTDLGPPR